MYWFKGIPHSWLRLSTGGEVFPVNARLTNSFSSPHNADLTRQPDDNSTEGITFSPRDSLAI